MQFRMIHHVLYEVLSSELVRISTESYNFKFQFFWEFKMRSLLLRASTQVHTQTHTYREDILTEQVDCLRVNSFQLISVVYIDSVLRSPPDAYVL